ncbi:TolC family protein [Sphingobacterium siyangense]|uniref:Outer membrane protein TolC n=1 Tax=Sphingobacterium siyangense TaxID=459529 RepID=A0A562LZJ7_9SPHI|nr:TolC family protein [Sphingobacterium siyangense]TWI13066.1 outer membrane protein TolC [Sphingobacterium siyangense]
MKIKTLIVCLILANLNFTNLHAQSALEKYINDGLESNNSIKQQNFLLEKNIFALEEAKRMFFPNVSFSTTYSKAKGGRTIDFPTGDLFNGINSTLNQITGTNTFPQLVNEQIQLNPNNFYDSKIRTDLPLLNSELIYNKKINKQKVHLQTEEVLLFKRELVKDIKTAYYQYLKSVKTVEIYSSALLLVEESRRINLSLFNNGKVNRSSVLRSENEVSKINTNLVDANKAKESAQYYFNFLLNRPLSEPIIIELLAEIPPKSGLIETDNNIENREELIKLKIGKEINDNQIKLDKSFIIPKVGTYLDMGSQAFNWQFNKQSLYYFWGISLEWNVFSSGKNSSKIKQSVAYQNSLIAQIDYVTSQLRTELKVKQNEMYTSLAEYEASKFQLKTSQTYYNDMIKSYKEGLVLYIELLDAQNQLTESQLKENIALYNTWISYVSVERANASFEIKKNNIK